MGKKIGSARQARLWSNRFREKSKRRVETNIRKMCTPHLATGNHVEKRNLAKQWKSGTSRTSRTTSRPGTLSRTEVLVGATFNWQEEIWLRNKKRTHREEYGRLVWDIKGGKPPIFSLNCRAESLSSNFSNGLGSSFSTCLDDLERTGPARR